MGALDRFASDASHPQPVLLLSGPEDDKPCEPAMKFRLTYEGVVRPTGNEPYGQPTDPLAPHKQKIRREFHRQLKHLWSVDRVLSTRRVAPKHFGKTDAERNRIASLLDPNGQIPLADAVSMLYREFDYEFVPLIREEWSLLCSLDILFLRRDFPGPGVISAGDIDNRVKTIIDTLRRPRTQQELVSDDMTPGAGETPFFVLMEDDNQVSHLSVEADRLLTEPVGDTAAQNYAKVIVTVEIRTFLVTLENLNLAF
jgi:hypothetical protein